MAAIDIGDVALRRPARGERCDVDLERPAHLDQVEQRTGVAADGNLEEVPDEPAVRRGHRRPPALLDLQQAARLQRARRLPHREAADAERLRELPLGREPLAGLEAAKDQRLELLDHRFDDRGASDRLQLIKCQKVISHVCTACLIC
jgi:hypothetical protein